MQNFKAVLIGLDPTKDARLEIVSGRRPRVVVGSEVRTVGDEVLSDDEVLDLCRSIGAGKAIDDLGDQPVTWVATGLPKQIRGSVVQRGRDVAATFTPIVREKEKDRDAAPPSAAAIRKSLPPRKLSQRIQAARQAFDAAAIPRRRPSVDRELLREVSRLGHGDAHQAETRRAEGPQRLADTPPRRNTPAPREAASREPAPREAPPREGAARRDTPRETAARRDTPRATRAQKATTRPSRAGIRLDDPTPAIAKLDSVRPGRSVDPNATTSPGPTTGHAQKLKPDATLMEVLAAAKRNDASDVHLSSGMPPALRIAGNLRNLKTTLSRADVERALRSILPDRLTRELVRTGGVCFALNVTPELRLRVNATTTFTGPKLALRIVRNAPPTIEDLGLPTEVERAIAQPQGLVLVVGPSGHGKTTTLSALMDTINRTRAAHLLSIEDPVEIPLPSKKSIVSQREVGTHAASFPRALEGALRQDPDVIAIGELRDLETVRIALSASETGHLVIATMNAPSAARAIERVIDVFPPAEQGQVRATLAGGLRLVASQRLVPTADGKGRVAALEILPGMVQLWNLIREEKTYQLPGLMQRGRSIGIIRLEDSLARLVDKGIITSDAAAETMADAETRADTAKVEPQVARPDLGATAGAHDGDDDLLKGIFQKAGALFNRKGGS